MIHSIPHPVSEGLRKENDYHVHGTPPPSSDHVRKLYPTCDSFCSDFLARPEGIQFASAVATLPAGARVLDIGPGYGMSSIYLASRGCRVSIVEPSLDLCRYVEAVAAAYGLALEIYHVPAEYLNSIAARDFDACIFNASLHHCDDPLRALENCHALLAPGGTIFLLNEPQLRLFRSKAWFYRQIEQDTLVTGHYGGNEHTYYHHEYLSMLKQARFGDIRGEVAQRYLTPDRYLGNMKQRGVAGGKILSRRLYYRLIEYLCRGGILGRPALQVLKHLSLVQTNFTATKRAAG